MAYTTPQVSDFKAQFVRDFPYAVTAAGSGDATNPAKVQDNDINAGLALASVNVNPAMFATQQLFTMGYLYLAAHYMVVNLRNSMQGVASKYNWLTVNRSVGNVTEGYEIPERVRKSPILSNLCTTTYGSQYLTMILPQLIGNYQSFHRCTLP